MSGKEQVETYRNLIDHLLIAGVVINDDQIGFICSGLQRGRLRYNQEVEDEQARKRQLAVAQQQFAF